MSNAQKTTFTFKIVGPGTIVTVKAANIRDAAIKAIGKNPKTKAFGTWASHDTGIIQVTRRMTDGVMVIGSVAIW